VKAGRLCGPPLLFLQALEGTFVGNKLRDEIKQNKPFSGLEQEALLNIRLTSGYIDHVFQQILKQHGLTEPQYNVLRILRGAGPGGLRCAEIGERMIARDPDITRLLDRLQRQRMIERGRDAKDRRVIHACISPAGTRILKELDPIVESAGLSVLKHISQARLELLIDLMEDVRQEWTASADLEAGSRGSRTE